MSLPHVFLVCLAVDLIGPALTGQQLAEGMASQVESLPAGASCPLLLPGGGIVYFDGNDLWRQTPGQPAHSLLHLPGFVFGSFTIAAGSTHVLFGENSTGTLWLVPLQGSPPLQPLASVAFNYDAALLDPQRAIVSAKNGGYGTPDNDLLLLDLVDGTTRPLASLPGASGPVAVAANGDVYYATASLAFPVPPAQTSLLRFRRAVVDAASQQMVVLGLADAESVFAGIDAAADICLDDDGDLLFTDWYQNTLGELNDVDSPAPWLAAPLVLYGTAPGAASVQFLTGGGEAVFEPFQPPGSQVVVFETDFFATSRLRFVVPARASLSTAAAAPIPAGGCTLVVLGGPANGLGLLAIALDDAPGSGALAVAGFEQPLHWSLALLGTQLLWPAPFDAQGTLSVSVWNPGFPLPTAATAQVALVSSLDVLGSSSSLPLVFGP